VRQTRHTRPVTLRSHVTADTRHKTGPDSRQETADETRQSTRDSTSLDSRQRQARRESDRTRLYKNAKAYATTGTEQWSLCTIEFSSRRVSFWPFSLFSFGSYGFTSYDRAQAGRWAVPLPFAHALRADTRTLTAVCTRNRQGRRAEACACSHVIGSLRRPPYAANGRDRE
jgi:hypothetical protein